MFIIVPADHYHHETGS